MGEGPVIIYTDHLKTRLRIREIPADYPQMIVSDPERTFYDVLEERYIAIKRLEYNNKERNMMVAYDRKDGGVEIVTIHPVREEQIENRVARGRWRR